MTKMQSAIDLLRAKRTQRKNCKEVEGVYSNLIRNGGARPLTNPEISRLKEYARTYFGAPHYHQWLKVYSAYRGEFLEGWIPLDFYEEILEKINNSYRQIAWARTLVGRLFGKEHFPDKAYYVKGMWLDQLGQSIASHHVKDIVFEDGEHAFAKIEASTQGKGVEQLQKNDFNPRSLEGRGNLVIQSKIEQHPWFDQIFPGCVATLRITTAIPYAGSRPTKHAAYLRVGQGKSGFVTSAGALRVAIICNEGSLDDRASDVKWRPYSSHPNTDFVFKDQKIPYFTDAIAVCERLHSRLPQFGIIGWDVAISATGHVKIMEWNAVFPSLSFSEATVGPCFKDLRLERFA